ncbi:MAG: NADP-dependent oxidoreductase [Pseudomonadaceae bacterium]|nr:NADP-dependent oxidoreductase [Pseudomonadaceae bacterium]
MTTTNRQFRLAARPQGLVKESDFRYEEAEKPVAADGEFVVKTEYISLDPSMRGQMENRADYVAPLEIGDVMRAGGVGHVIESRNPDYPEGTLVAGTFGMQDYAVVTADMPRVRRLPDGTDPVLALGVLGTTGMTAYFGLLDIGEPTPGDVVLVSGAAGATGSIAGQIAKLKGCRVVGIAGSDDKCNWLLDELGFDGAINYKTADIGAEIDRLCPTGIDIYFDNVGGEILDLALDRIRDNARVVLCGGISRYNATGPVPGPVNYFNLVFRRARMEGFIVLDYADKFEAAGREMSQWIADGALKQQATVKDGFKLLPSALIDLFTGANTGKMMVKTS